MKISRNNIRVVVLLIVGFVSFQLAHAQSDTIRLVKPTQDLVENILELNLEDNRYRGTFYIDNQTGDNAASKNWTFSTNVLLESCTEGADNYDAKNRTITLQNNLEGLTFSLLPDFKSNSRFSITNSSKEVVYSAVIKYPIIGAIQYDEENYIHKDSIRSISFEISNKGIADLEALVEVKSANTKCEPVTVKVDSLSKVKGTIKCNYLEVENTLDSLGNFKATLLVTNKLHTEDRKESAITFNVRRKNESFFAEQVSLPTWLFYLMILILAILLFFVVKAIFFKKETKRDTSSTDQNAIPLEKSFKDYNHKFLLSISNYFLENEKWPSDSFFTEQAKEGISHAEQLFGKDDNIQMMLTSTRKLLMDNLEDYDENGYPEIMNRAIIIMIILKKAWQKPLFTEEEESLKRNLTSTLESASLFNDLLERNTDFNRGNILNKIEELISSNKGYQSKLVEIESVINSTKEDKEKLEKEQERLESELTYLKEKLDNPDGLYLYEYFLSILSNTLNKIRNLNWGEYRDLQNLFMRQLKGNDDDKLIKYRKYIKDFEEWPRTMSDEHIDKFVYLFSEIFRLDVFSRFPPFRKVFEEVNFPYSEFSVVLQCIRGLWLQNSELELVIPEVYVTSFNEKKHSEAEGTSNIISAQIISVNENEGELKVNGIRDFQSIGLFSDKINISKKAKVYVKK
jgi:hypothetical protein